MRSNKFFFQISLMIFGLTRCWGETRSKTSLVKLWNILILLALLLATMRKALFKSFLVLSLFLFWCKQNENLQIFKRKHNSILKNFEKPLRTILTFNLSVIFSRITWNYLWEPIKIEILVTFSEKNLEELDMETQEPNLHQ